MVGAWSMEGKALVQLCQRSQCYQLDHHALLRSMNASGSWVGMVAALPPTPAHHKIAFPEGLVKQFVKFGSSCAVRSRILIKLNCAQLAEHRHFSHSKDCLDPERDPHRCSCS